MKEETKPEMTAEEFLRCWIEDKEDITLARQHLRSVIRGKLVEFLEMRTLRVLPDSERTSLRNQAEQIADDFLNNNQ